MDQVRIGVIGVGNMGTSHAAYLHAAEIKGARLTALLEERPERVETLQELYGSDVEIYSDEEAFFTSGRLDAVLVATPHFSHPRLAIRAFQEGLHVLCEKPAGVYTKQVREMNEAAAKSNLVFSMMYNQRTNPLYKRLRELIRGGKLGAIRRINWIITDWYRSQSYYDSSNWRATWSGEGGGVLINQCPHQLDLWGWLTGMTPSRLRAFCSFGKYRNIEVEDDVTAFAEYENGASAVFITTTGETPGTNRLEITGTQGKAVVEDGELSFWQLQQSEPEFNQQFQGGFGEPESWKCEIPIRGKETGHPGITQNFVNAILQKEPLIAPGEEGIHGLTLSNAMQLSTWTDGWVNFPLDEDLYYDQLQVKIKQSTVKKDQTVRTLDVKGSH
ncbi:Gfo/Idh/MocA family protein [Shouchella shacheensis]|uniref:Gfo/Idh/MocA family protein n=1 Tax=Shouchella shacheensis TaxID=1649580 RepID=UPI00073FFB58|nr:Gfo/Idh/MocA family oxidoreductase [Shouchella shacheensis]